MRIHPDHCTPCPECELDAGDGDANGRPDGEHGQENERPADELSETEGLAEAL